MLIEDESQGIKKNLLQFFLSSKMFLIKLSLLGEGFPFENDMLSRSNIGAIYECNSRCNCDITCPNRVIQRNKRVPKKFQVRYRISYIYRQINLSLY